MKYFKTYEGYKLGVNGVGSLRNSLTALKRQNINGRYVDPEILAKAIRNEYEAITGEKYEDEVQMSMDNTIADIVGHYKLDGPDFMAAWDKVVKESVNEAKGGQIFPGDYVKNQHGNIYLRVDGKVGRHDAYVRVTNGKAGKRKTGLHDSFKLTLVNKDGLEESVVNEAKFKEGQYIKSKSDSDKFAGDVYDISNEVDGVELPKGTSFEIRKINGGETILWSDADEVEYSIETDDLKKHFVKESVVNEGSDQARLTHLRKFGIAPNNQPQNAAYIKQVSKPGKFFVDWKDAFDLGDVALEFVKSVGSISEFDIIDLKTMKRTGKQLDVKKGQLGNLRTTYGVRVNESVNERLSPSDFNTVDGLLNDVSDYLGDTLPHDEWMSMDWEEKSDAVNNAMSKVSDRHMKDKKLTNLVNRKTDDIISYFVGSLSESVVTEAAKPYKKGQRVNYQLDHKGGVGKFADATSKSKNIESGVIKKRTKGLGGTFKYELTNGLELYGSEIVGLTEAEFKHINKDEHAIKLAIKDVEKKARLKANRNKPLEYEQLSLNKIMLSKVLGREKLGKEHQAAWEKLKKEYSLKESVVNEAFSKKDWDVKWKMPKDNLFNATKTTDAVNNRYNALQSLLKSKPKELKAFDADENHPAYDMTYDELMKWYNKLDESVVTESYKGNFTDFKYDLEMAIDNMDISPKSIKSVKKKGKGYEVRLSSYMSDKSTWEKIGKTIGATLMSFKPGGINIGIYE